MIPYILMYLVLFVVVLFHISSLIIFWWGNTLSHCHSTFVLVCSWFFFPVYSQVFDVCTLIWVCALQFWVKFVYMLITFCWLIIQISLVMITFCSNVSIGKGEGHWSYYRFVYSFRVFCLCSWRVWVFVHTHLESCLLLNQSLHFHIMSFYIPSKVCSL